MPRTMKAIVIGLLLPCISPIDLLAYDKLGPDGFISGVGTYRLYHGELSLRIYEEKGKLNYKVGHRISVRVSSFRREQMDVASGPAEPFIERGEKWFALVESPRSRTPRAIWIFDGRDLLVQIAYTNGDRDDDWRAVLYHSDTRPSIVTDAPREVWDRLPESFKEKFGAKSR